MQIVFFTHPSFQSHQSMPRFAKMLADGMQARGHQVKMWSPKARFRNLPVPGALKKWMGYIDQYIIFPMEVRLRKRKVAADTLYVFTDQALGPWIPMVVSKPHVIHCHDFLAQRSALGEIPENRTGWTGQKYQAFIHNGYSKGRHFISVSEKTRQDLKRFLPAVPETSAMVYNGLNQSFHVQDATVCRSLLTKKLSIDLMQGFILHVGGNQWYKNRVGVIEIYNAWRSGSPAVQLPLLLMGHEADEALRKEFNNSPYQKDIYLLTGMTDEQVRQAYSGASVFLFPSRAEGFGWPIAEAMASGCLVITTNEAPMTEVAGDAAMLIPRRPFDTKEVEQWALASAATLNEALNLSAAERHNLIAKGLINAQRFNSNQALDAIEKEYKKIINTYTK